MIKNENIHSSTEPSQIEITTNAVYITENIHTYTELIDNYTIEGYEYDLLVYTLPEYIELLTQKNTLLEEELQATKILLGVE